MVEGGALAKGLKIEFSFVPFPQEIWRGEGVDLTEAEFKLLGYLLYHQARFGQRIIALSDGECLEGKKLANGQRLDRGCGIKGRNNFKAAREKLIHREWLEYTPGEGYKVLLSTILAEVSEIDSEVSKTDTLSVQNGQAKCPNQTPEVSKTDTHNKEDKNEQERTKKKTKPPQLEIPDWVPRKDWDDWMEVREKLGAPKTDRSQQIAINRLIEFRTRGHPPEQILQLAIERGWRGLFEPKESTNGNGKLRAQDAAAGTRAAVQAGVDKWLHRKNAMGTEHVPGTVTPKPGDPG